MAPEPLAPKTEDSPGPQEKGNHSGLWLAVVGPDAAATAPGVVSRAKEEAAGLESSSARANAVSLGKLFEKRFGDCARKGDETKVLADNALEYADTYAVEAGFRRRISRMGAPNSRAAWFARDVLKSMGNAGWCFYETARELRLPDFLCVAPYRMAERMPLSDAHWGSLYGEGYVYHFAARFSSFVPAGVHVAHAHGELRQSRHD